MKPSSTTAVPAQLVLNTVDIPYQGRALRHPLCQLVYINSITLKNPSSIFCNKKSEHWLDFMSTPPIIRLDQGLRLMELESDDLKQRVSQVQSSLSRSGFSACVVVAHLAMGQINIDNRTAREHHTHRRLRSLPDARVTSTQHSFPLNKIQY